LIDTFKRYNIKAIGKPIYVQKTGNATVYHFATRTYPELKEIYDLFYVNKKKLVPKTLSLSPVLVRQWYLGDGSLNRRKDKKENPTITFATNSFTEGDVDFLVSKFISIGIKAKKYKGFTINIPYSSLSTFFEYIGKCPIEIYKYKWIINSH